MLEVILKLTDQFSAPLRQSESGLKGFGASLKTFAASAVSLGGIGLALNKAWNEADEFTRSMQRVEGTAKIVGVPLEVVKQTAADAANQFGLSATAANNFASSAVTMAAKAGDVSKSGALMNAVLDLAAARGISAEEALEALNITLKGQDEGLDKLVQRNPSAYYKSWADAAGRSAGSLSDVEKMLSITDGLIADGASVRGQMVSWLETVDGKAFLAGQAMQDANAKFGVATETLRILMLDAKGWAADLLGGVVQFFQKVGVELALSWDTVGNMVRGAIGSLQMTLGAFIAQSRVVLAFLPDSVAEMAEQLQDAGVANKIAAEKSSREVSAIRAEMYAEIEGVTTVAERNLTGTVEDNAGKRGEASAKEAEQRKKDTEAAVKALEGLRAAFLDAYDTEKNPAIKKTREAIAKITEALQTQRGFTEEQRAELLKMQTAYAENLGLLDDAVTLEEELARARDLPFQESKLRVLNGLYQDAVQLRATEGATAETIAYYDALILDLQEEITGEMAENVPLQRAMADAARAGQMAYAMMTGDVRAIAALMPDVADNSEKMDSSLFNAARGAVSLAKEMGIVDQQTAGVLNNAITLADTLKNGLAGLSSGDMIGAIGSLAGIVSGIFAGDPARMALIRKNTEGLEKLRGAVGDLLRATTPGGKLASASEFARDFTPDGLFDGRSRAGPGALAKALAPYGLTIADLNEIAKQENVDFDFNTFRGGSDMVFLNALLDKLKASEFGQFGQDFPGQQDFLERYFDVAGITDPAQQAAFIADALKKDPENSYLAGIIGSADLNTEEGRQALRDTFTSIMQQMNNGTFNADYFGGLTGTQFLDFIESFIGLVGNIGTGFGSGIPMPVTAMAEPGFMVPSSVPSTFGDMVGMQAFDMSLQLGAPLLRVATGVEELVEIARTRSPGGDTIINIGTINGRDGGALRDATLDAINEALAADRDLRQAAGV